MTEERAKVSIVKQVGLECPRCGCRDFRVLRTIKKPDNRIARRRECRHCGRRITTWEIGPKRYM